MLDEEMILRTEGGIELEIAQLLDGNERPVEILSDAVYAIATNEYGDYETFYLVASHARH